MQATDRPWAAEFAQVAEEVLAKIDRSQKVAFETGRDAASPTAWSMAHAAGWTGILVPERCGGLGLGLPELAAVHRAAGAHLFVGPLAESSAFVATIAGGAGPDGDQLAQRLLNGETIALADPAAAGGELLVDGDRMRGRVHCARYAASADLVLAVGRTSGDDVVVAAFPRDDPGVRISQVASMDPTTQLCDIEIDAALTPGAVLKLSDAAASLASARNRMRIVLSCERYGIAAHCLSSAVGYAKERIQFNRPIGSFQAVQQILAEAARQVFSLDRLCEEVAAAADAASSHDLGVLAATLDSYSADVTRQTVEQSLQVHGGIAFTIEHSSHLYYKRTLTMEGLYGEPSDQWEALGRTLLSAGADPWGWRRT